VVPDGYANFHLVFLLKLARLLGFAPNTEEYSEGSLFDLSRGRFVPCGVPSDELLCGADAALLYRLVDTDYAEMDAVAMSRSDRARIIRHLARYYALHIPSFPAIKSLEVLQEVMGA
jgi:DNA repair protein RecO (recombination protein O)